jgi:hypothetical protein
MKQVAVVAQVGLLSAVLVMSASLRSASAQGSSGSVAVLATTLAPLEVTGMRDLDFGTMTGGVPRTVTASDNTAGRFRVRGVAGAVTLATFTLPTELSNGAQTFPLGSWTGRQHTSAGNGGTAFDPVTPGLAVTLTGGGGQKFLFLGATASAPAGQQPGLYTATITLSVIYQ